MDPDPRSLADALDRRATDAEVAATWAASHQEAFRMIDVREPHELAGPLGHIEGVENIPLVTLVQRAPTLDPDEPTLLICRSGRRSAAACTVLANHGIRIVASVEGGMIAWNLNVWNRRDILKQEQVANTANLAEAIDRRNGLPEVSAQWVANNLGRFRLFDVRDAEELELMGRVAQVEHVPLDRFTPLVAAMPRDAPLVLMCASGRRSGRAVLALEEDGFTAVASVEGGLLGWRAHGLPWI